MCHLKRLYRYLQINVRMWATILQYISEPYLHELIQYIDINKLTTSIYAEFKDQHIDNLSFQLVLQIVFVHYIIFLYSCIYNSEYMFFRIPNIIKISHSNNIEKVKALLDDKIKLTNFTFPVCDLNDDESLQTIKHIRAQIGMPPINIIYDKFYNEKSTIFLDEFNQAMS